MSHKDVGLLLAALIFFQGCIAIFLSYGLNGDYFKNSPNIVEAFKRLRADKPITARIVGGIYLLCLAEFLIAVLHNLGRT